MNRYFFALSSPFKKQSFWKGVIFADSQITGPSVSVLGRQFIVTLSESGHAHSVALDRIPPLKSNRMTLITKSNLRNSIIICELLREKQQLFLVPRAKTWWVFVEGKKPDKKTELHPYDIIVFQGGGGQQVNLLYQGFCKPILAYTKWRNGKQRRIFPYGHSFPMAYTLAKAVDTAKSKGKLTPRKLELSIDISLHQTLKKSIRRFANGDFFYQSKDPLKSPRIALTVMDAFSGEVLALPGYPGANPGNEDFERELFYASPHDQVRLLTNFNLLNHENGSTFKPHILSALGTAFWPIVNIGEFMIYSRCQGASVHSGPGQTCIHNRIGGIPILPWDSLSTTPFFNTKDFLVQSEDYGIITGWLGLVLKKKDIYKVLVRQESNPDFAYKNKGFIFDLCQLEPQASPFSLEDVFPRITSSIEHSLVFKYLERLFDFYISSDYHKVLEYTGKYFLPSFKYFDFRNNLYLNNVIPEPVIFNPRYYQYNRGDLISFFLGGGPNRINNVAMAQSAARMATDKKVAATIEKKSPNPGYSETLPSPLRMRGWRNENLVVPMEEVGKSGTAKILNGIVEPPLKVIYKTGTIIKYQNKGLESETLLFVIGEWRDGQYVKGKTLSGFLYMEKSKERKSPQKKFQLARPIIKALVEYLKEKNKN